MTSELTPACLSLRADGTPCSEMYGDVYHSFHGAHAQAKHVFISGNKLPERWQGKERFDILEAGFGLGLNFLATWLAWRNDPQACRTLNFVSLEKHPCTSIDLARIHATWPEFSEIARALHQCWPALVSGEHRLEFEGGRVVLTLVFGDALESLQSLDAVADAFYLDGFSPAKNPEIWSHELCCSLAKRANPGATLATWSVSGVVRRALLGAGFDVKKQPGFASKWQMLVGCYQSPAEN